MSDTTEALPCAACGHPTLPRDQHRALPKPRTTRVRAGGDLCRPCYRASGRKSGRAKPIARELVLADWQWLHETGELHAGDSLAQRIKVAAPRMGMAPDALEKALQRAGIRNPAEPGLRADLITANPIGCHECRKHASTVTRAEADVRRLARMLAAHPDSRRMADHLDTARTRLAREQAERDWHAEYGDHDDVEVAA